MDTRFCKYFERLLKSKLKIGFGSCAARHYYKLASQKLEVHDPKEYWLVISDVITIQFSRFFGSGSRPIRYEHQFQKLLYVFASSAMTLVDQARALSQKVPLPEYEARVRETFATNPRHRFFKNCVSM